MSEITAFGDVTKTIFLNEAESHKLHLAFEAEGTIKKGQPVVLNTAETVSAAPDTTTNTTKDNIIGYAIQNAVDGEEVTIAMRGYATVFAMSQAALNAGPVKYAGVNSGDPRYMNYNQATEVATVLGLITTGWSLDTVAAANLLIRVVVKV
jgi:hypothetical protein